MWTRFSAVETEPVCARKPYFVAVHVIEAASLGMKPVIVIRVDCLNVGRFH